MARKRLENSKLIYEPTQDQTHEELSPAELKRACDFFSLLIDLDRQQRRKEAASKQETRTIIGEAQDQMRSKQN